MPPETQAPGNVYTYDPIPARTNPPVGPNLLTHLFEHPGDAEVLPVLYRKVPKKLHARLRAGPPVGSAVGWGIQFVEGLDLLVVFRVGCAGFAAALAVALAWSVARKDLQSGFAMAGFMLAFLGFALGIARAEVQVVG